MVDVRSRHFSPFASLDPLTEEVKVDTAGLLQSLLLFDCSIVQSHSLREIPRLIELFDYRGLMSLLAAEALEFQPVRALPGVVDGSQVSLVLDPTKGVASRPGAFNLTVVRIGPRREGRPSNVPQLPVAAQVEYIIEDDLEVVHSLESISRNRRYRLVEAVNKAIKRPPNDLWDVANGQTHLELDRTPDDLRRAVENRLTRALRREIPTGAVQIRIHREDATNLLVEHNLDRDFGLDLQVAHAVVGNALLALARLNTRLAFQNAHQAVSGVREDELPYWERKVEFVHFLVQEAGPTIENFQRVIEISGLPSLVLGIEKGALDVDRLLKVRSSNACVEFRHWLHALDRLTEKEAVERVTELRARIGTWLDSGLGRVLRFAAVTGAGLTPLGPSPGTAIGVLDNFILTKFFRASGPTTFLSRGYPSMFEMGRM